MLNWIWNGISIELPPEWELLQFSRDPERGRCAFADRHRFRFELDWATVPGEPDFDRMLSDYAQKLEADGKMQSTGQVIRGGIRGLTGSGPNGAVSRFGIWFKEQRRLVECVFLWDGERNKELESSILKSLRQELPVTAPDAPRPLQHWRAFGMDLLVPENFRLASCSVLPGQAGMLFRGKHPADTWIFRRYGLTQNWFKGDLQDWLKRQLPDDVRRPTLGKSQRSDMETACATGRYRPKGLLKRSGKFKAECWLNSMDSRIYLGMISNLKFEIPHDPSHFLKSAPDFTVVP